MSGASFTYKASATGSAFMQSDKFIKVIMGPVGGGKSTVCLFELFRRALTQRPYNKVRRTKYIIVRNTMQQLRSTVKPLIDEWFVVRPEGKWGQWRMTDNTFELRLQLPDGTRVFSEFCMMPADTPDDVRRLLSLEASGAWCEEWREIDPEVFDNLQGRTMRFPSVANGGVSYPGVICSTNPPPMGTFHEEFISNPPKNAAIFVQPGAVLDDGSINPDAENLQFLDANYYPNLMEGKAQGWIDVYLKNKFGPGGFGEPVFKETFRRDFHVAKTPLKLVPVSNNPVLVGMDNGLTAAAVIGQMDARGRVNVVDEAYVPEGQSMGVETFLDRILVPKLLALGVPSHQVRFVLDPACFQRSQINEMTIAMAVQSRGYQVIKAVTNDPVRRIGAVEGLLTRSIDGGPGLLISPECSWLARALDFGYRNKKMANGKVTAEPEKNHFSHIADALQYFCLHYNLQVHPAAGMFRTAAKEIKAKTFNYV